MIVGSAHRLLIYVVLAQTINIGRIVTGRWLLSRAPIGHRR